MSSESLKALQTLLATLPQESLAHEAGMQSASRDSFIKAGILPFLPAASMENWRVCVMKPVTARPELGEPSFQLCKGTRMKRTPSGWQDLKTPPAPGDETESLAETALREGMEELGLVPRCIVKLVELGAMEFTSASTGKTKSMWLFAAEMQGEDSFTSIGDVAFTTAARNWMTLAEFEKHGRKDFIPILRESLERLAAHYAQHS